MGRQLIDEEHFAQHMDTVVLPALERCSSDGWMEPAKLAGVDGIGPPKGTLHYICYDSAKFSELQVPGAIARFRGTVVISHGFTEFAGKYAEFIWYLLLEGYSVCEILTHHSQTHCRRAPFLHIRTFDGWWNRRRFTSGISNPFRPSCAFMPDDRAEHWFSARRIGIFRLVSHVRYGNGQKTGARLSGILHRA